MVRHVIAVVIALMPFGTAAHSAIECKAELPAVKSGYWSWRNIDGKKCWYQGKPGMDRANLQWSRSPGASDSDRALLESYWPNLRN